MTSIRQDVEGQFWADKFMDLANLQIIVMVFGQFTTAQIYWPGLAAGVIIYILLIGIALKLRNKKS